MNRHGSTHRAVFLIAALYTPKDLDHFEKSYDVQEDSAQLCGQHTIRNRGISVYIKKIDIKNFRLLREVGLSLEDRTTVIVGRNNSGKTSLTELFRRLLSDGSPTFRLEDFSLGAHEQFWVAFSLAQQGKTEVEIRAALPTIEMRLTLTYDRTVNLGPLGDFVIDLDEACTEAVAEIRYELDDGKIETLFDAIDLSGASGDPEKRNRVFKALKERVPKQYKVRLFAVDPNDATNRKHLEWNRLPKLVQGGFINAQRGLDDTTHRDNDVLGKILGVLFETAMSASADPGDRNTAQELASAVQTIQEDIDTKFNERLDSLLPAFALFGYPGLPDPNLRTETMFDVERLLNNHTKIHYPGVNGVNLPEAYNGLGARNLIFILLKLHEFFKAYKAMQPAPGVHMVFIEEPEAHLHPQMQEVFISKLGFIADVFATTYNGGQKWPVQFVVTTHSSHLANRAPFKAMRYFLATAQTSALGKFYSTKIKDLSKGLAGEFKDDEKFLHQYMTLTRCDLLFADKAILIEGTTERLLLPKMIEKGDGEKAPELKLSSQYLSTMEVGGAYAHRFFKLLEFLELRTLIVTDLDTAKDVKGKLGACKVTDGTRTTNGCIKTWFAKPDISPTELIAKSATEKTAGLLRLAFQVPEAAGKPCGRSFEETFILANPTLFGLTTALTAGDRDAAWDLAADQKKSEFALKYAIEDTNWTVPRYIAEGLEWLAQNLTQPAAVSAAAPAKPKVAKATKK